MKKTFKKKEKTLKKNKRRKTTLKRKRQGGEKEKNGSFFSNLSGKASNFSEYAKDIIQSKLPIPIRRIRNQGVRGYDGFTLDGPTTSDKVEEDFVAPAETHELSDDERVSSFTSTLTPDMKLDERLPGLIDTLGSIKDDKNFEKALMSLPNNVITKLPMDIIGRRARLGGKSKRRRATKRRRR